MRPYGLIGLLITLAPIGLSQSLDQSYSVKEEWRFPNSAVTGFIFDAEVDDDGQMAIMFFRDGVKIISAEKVQDLAPFGHGPGDIDRWVGLAFEGPYLVDIEGSGRLQYFKKIQSSYHYDKTDWLFHDNEFPFVKGAIPWRNQWFLAGFSSSNPQSESVQGYFLSIFQDKGQPAKRLIFKDFNGAFRGPYLLTVHIRQHFDRIWAMLESEPILYVISGQINELEKSIRIPMPDFYRPIRDYWRFEHLPLSQIKKGYENWLLSYSRIETFRVTDKNLIVQLRTANDRLPRFAMLFYDIDDFSLRNIYFTPHLFLTEKSGRLFFFENGDPGLDETAQTINILIYERK